MPRGFATHHPGGMADNSPTFQRWEPDRNWVQVPKGRLKLCPWSAVHSGIIARSDGVPNVETLGYCRKSLRDALRSVLLNPLAAALLLVLTACFFASSGRAAEVMTVAVFNFEATDEGIRDLGAKAATLV